MIEIKNLTKKFGEQIIFDDVSLSLPSRGIVCLLGASGSGKSTLFHMLAGMDKDYQGTILVQGKDLHSLDEDARCGYRHDKIGFVFQDYQLLSGYTVLDNILLACGQDEDQTSMRERALMLLQQMDMFEKRNEYVEHLSGGQKQRTAIARALLHQPSILLADEPTGALDRKNATEIMELLQSIAKEHLVLLITHDDKLTAFADALLTIRNHTLVGELPKEEAPVAIYEEGKPCKPNTLHQAGKNFRLHISRYIAIALVITLGCLLFILSLSSGNLIEVMITDFKEKNTALQNGYVKNNDDSEELMEILKADKRVENVYAQYILSKITLEIEGTSIPIGEKYPMPKSSEVMSYGTMPLPHQKEIAISPSLAKKFASDIHSLLGKKVMLTYQDISYELTLSGIFNAGYDDFFLSSDIEQQCYAQMDPSASPYAISYDSRTFEDMIPVAQMLNEQGFQVESAIKEVTVLQQTFHKVERLFQVVSGFILLIAIFISAILLGKQQKSRIREIGLYIALGFPNRAIKRILLTEMMMLAMSAMVFSGGCITLVYVLSAMFALPITLTIPQIICTCIGAGVLLLLISRLASHRLLHYEPIKALRM